MEEQNKNTEKKENEVQTSQENTPQNATPTRSYVLMILAGMLSFVYRVQIV